MSLVAESTGHFTSFVPCLLGPHLNFMWRWRESTACFAFARMLPPRRPLRPARTTRCRTVHRTVPRHSCPREFASRLQSVKIKNGLRLEPIFIFMVEVARVELASESISKGLSPSAVNVLEFRLDQRPLTGYGLSYPVSPL